MDTGRNHTTELHTESLLPPHFDAGGGAWMEGDQKIDDPLLSGEQARLEIACDPCPGIRMCAGLQFMQPAADL
ncbi:MAG: hypothetical protein SGJ26_10790 [Nitrospirota bacterium]|nr:hypothetical protein [Nitrospirota bacterium]